MSSDSASRYAELLRKVHTMDALADSNRLMREEKEGLQNSLAEFKAKYESIQKQIEPLQEKLRLNDNRIESLMVSVKDQVENWIYQLTYSFIQNFKLSSEQLLCDPHSYLRLPKVHKVLHKTEV